MPVDCSPGQTTIWSRRRWKRVPNYRKWGIGEGTNGRWERHDPLGSVEASPLIPEWSSRLRLNARGAVAPHARTTTKEPFVLRPWWIEASLESLLVSLASSYPRLAQSLRWEQHFHNYSYRWSDSGHNTCTRWMSTVSFLMHGPLAQLAEQMTLNH